MTSYISDEMLVSRINKELKNLKKIRKLINLKIGQRVKQSYQNMKYKQLRNTFENVQHPQPAEKSKLKLL